MKLTLRGEQKFLFWALLLSLTSFALAFPVSLDYEIRPLESPYIFGNKLPLFVLLYLIWLSLLFLLLFSKGLDLEKVGLVCIFALVFWSFWGIIKPQGDIGDELFNLAHIKFLQEKGRVDFAYHPFTYLQFPGLHLLGYSISEITSLKVMEIRFFFTLFFPLLCATWIYTFFRVLLKNTQFASLTTVLLITGNWTMAEVMGRFHPIVIGFVLSVPFLFQLTQLLKHPSISNKLVFVIFLASLTISYFTSSLFAIFALLGVFLVHKSAKTRGEGIPFSTVVLASILVITWTVYVATIVLHFGMEAYKGFIEEVLRREFFWFLQIQAERHFGEKIPLWASLTRMFWFALMCGLGVLLGLKNLKSIKRFDWAEKIQTGGLIGVILFSLPMLLTGGGYHVGRALKFIGFFTAPIIMGFAFKAFHYPKVGLNLLFKFLLPLLIIALFVLNPATFFAHHYQVSSTAFYPFESSYAEFLKTNYNKGENLWLFSDESIFSIVAFYFPEAQRSSMWGPRDEAELHSSLNKLITAFEGSEGEKVKIFIFSKRMTFSAQKWGGIEPGHPLFIGLEKRLNEHNLFYSNGYVKFYTPI